MCDSQPSQAVHVGVYDETQDEEEWDDLLMSLNEHGTPRRATQQRDNSKDHLYQFHGVDVYFPYKAYPSQEQMMEKLIQGSLNGENSLLESPTGSGKTAALLCGLLAFVQSCSKNSDFGQAATKSVEKIERCCCGLVIDPDNPENSKVTIVESKYRRKFRLESVALNDSSSFRNHSRASGSPNKIQKLEPSISSTTSCEVRIVKKINELCMYCIKKYLKEFRPPRIYYSTRTHSQIEQVVKQLKNTRYADVKMTILSSRQLTCINSKLKGELSQPSDLRERPFRSLDEGCSTLKRNYLWNRKEEQRQLQRDIPKEVSLKEECPYFSVRQDLIAEFKSLQDSGAWDIEDLVKHGKECSSCPFFGSQLLHETAEIIFCPYNYLICPSIRENTNVVLANSIIVFDEAHNIEDICRSAASFSIDHDNLDIHIRRAFDIHLRSNVTVPPSKLLAVQHFSDVLLRLSTWILNEGNKIIVQFENSQPYRGFLYTVIVQTFSSIGLGPETLDTHLKMLGDLKPDEFDKDDKKENVKKNTTQDLSSTIVEEPFFQVAAEALIFVTDLLYVLDLMYRNDFRRLMDYKVVVVNTKPVKPSSNLSAANHRKSKYQLDIMCLNPAVSFEPIKNASRSIIVASGTLSPMQSFSSELDTPFAITLSADHVINRSQVWAGVVSQGPLTTELRLTKKFQDLPEVQDEIGNVVLQICEIVPHGVLVFLPSYGLMNTLKARWTNYPLNNPIFNRIRKLKIVYFEESKNKEIFKKDMIDFKANIKAASSSNNGCLLFAVFRGKVSEGIDFTDDYARAVITVGIPYPNCFAYDVQSKKTYNDIRLKQPKNPEITSNTNQVLSGSEWYKVQAFRAINQGFGRCIRHKDDWGAIIMIDDRLAEKNNKEYLSGWVAKQLKTFSDFKTLKDSLSTFVDRQLKVEDEMQSLSENDDDKHPTTQVCKTSELDCFAQTKRWNKSLVELVKPTCSRSNYPVANFSGVDNSTYEIEEFEDDGNDYIFNDVNVQTAMDNARTLHEQTTLPIDVDIQSGSDVSYHSDTSLPNTSIGEADTSVDMFLGTP